LKRETRNKRSSVFAKGTKKESLITFPPKVKVLKLFFFFATDTVSIQARAFLAGKPYLPNSIFAIKAGVSPKILDLA
jgi:hypothetical protein